MERKIDQGEQGERNKEREKQIEEKIQNYKSRGRQKARKGTRSNRKGLGKRQKYKSITYRREDRKELES